jgi:hypothetical protein
MKISTETLPRWETYCENTNAAAALKFDLGNGLEVWYSYKTPVAFRHTKGLKVRKNAWGPTTGKHLNAIDGGDKSHRLDGMVFEEQLAELLESLT